LTPAIKVLCDASENLSPPAANSSHWVGRPPKRQDRWPGSNIALLCLTSHLPSAAGKPEPGCLAAPTVCRVIRRGLIAICQDISACHFERSSYWGRWGYHLFWCSESLTAALLVWLITPADSLSYNVPSLPHHPGTRRGPAGRQQSHDPMSLQGIPIPVPRE
jgi:hypothetical protein